MIPLINKLDNFEQVRTAVAQILAAETVSQQALATAAELDPSNYVFDVYIERINPWDALEIGTPIVNVWFENLRSEKNGSTSTRQKVTSRINVDVYVSADSYEDGTGHVAGDEQAAKGAQRIARLIRNILMHDDYRHLGLSDGIVWTRSVQDITMFQPASGNQPVENVIACRVALDVEHNEEMVFAEEVLLEGIHIEFYYEAGGLLRAELDYGAVEGPEE